ncbi:MAG: hypothetical protein R6W82_10125 [bacterium]
MHHPRRKAWLTVLLTGALLQAACTGPDGGDPRTGSYEGWFSLGNTSTGSTALTVFEDGTAELLCTFTGTDPSQGTFHLRLEGRPHLDSHGDLTSNDLMLTRFVPGVDTTSGQAAIFGRFHAGLDYFNGEWEVMPDEEVPGAGFWFASKHYRP